MRNVWLHKDNRDKCIVFCNGWGMDAFPFAPLQSDNYDVVTLFDYQDMALPSGLRQEINRYRERILVGWSMGVWAGQQLFPASVVCFSQAIAINGTLCPVHDQFGIPSDIVKGTLESWDENTRGKFYRRMCREKTSLQCFLLHQPERTCDSQKNELAFLLHRTGCGKPEKSIYTRVFVAENDQIMPTANQRDFWQSRSPILLDSFHFPFYSWASWDELLASVEKYQTCTAQLRET